MSARTDQHAALSKKKITKYINFLFEMDGTAAAAMNSGPIARFFLCYFLTFDRFVCCAPGRIGHSLKDKLWAFLLKDLYNPYEWLCGLCRTTTTTTTMRSHTQRSDQRSKKNLMTFIVAALPSLLARQRRLDVELRRHLTQILLQE